MIQFQPYLRTMDKNPYQSVVVRPDTAKAMVDTSSEEKGRVITGLDWSEKLV